MTKTSRRAIVAGLAATPLAGLPALAPAAPGADPALAALAEHDRARSALDAAYSRTRSASAKLDAAREALGLVIYKGEEVHSLRQLEALCRAEPKDMSDEDLERAIADLRRNNAAIRAAASRPDREYEAARAALIEREPALEPAIVEMQEVEEAEDAPLDALNEAETAIVAAKPTTRAGAAAQLRFIADHFEELIDDSRELAPDALRAVADLLAADPVNA